MLPIIEYEMNTSSCNDPSPEPLSDAWCRKELHKIHVVIHCPSCDWKQIVPLDDWLFQSKYGHGYTCGSGKCPSHTYLIREDADDQFEAIAAQAREEVLDDLEHWVIKEYTKRGEHGVCGLFEVRAHIISLREAQR